MNWKWHVAMPIIVAVLVSAILWPILWSFARVQVAPYVPDMKASVFIETSVGTGSGVIIGDGQILTASHVVGASQTITVQYADGGRVKGEVLWSNTKYDIALIRVAHRPWPESAPLDCAVPVEVGERVALVGNPMGVTFVYTAGVVVGEARAFGPWPSVMPIDGAVVYGQSGGGVINAAGRTIGITVGLLPTQYGIAAFGWVVPAAVICPLLARA